MSAHPMTSTRKDHSKVATESQVNPASVNLTRRVIFNSRPSLVRVVALAVQFRAQVLFNSLFSQLCAGEIECVAFKI